MKRPLCAVLVLLTVCIICFYKVDENSSNTDKKNITVRAYVEEILGTSEVTALIVRDVVPDKQSAGENQPFASGDESPDLSDKPVADEVLFKRLKVYAGKSFSDDKCDLSGVGIGNVIRLTGDISMPESPGNPGQFDEQAYYRAQGLDAILFVNKCEVITDSEDGIAMFLYRVRCFIAGAFLSVMPEREAGILSAMILGEKSGLDSEIKELYSETGIAHILAISGLHISMIGMGLFAFLRRFIMPMRWAAVITGVVLFLYGILTGFPVATRRAVIMTVLVLIARLIGERYDRINALALAAIVELVTHPASLYQAGFLLSYGTVLGIALFVDELSGIFVGDERSVWQKLFEVISGSVGITVVTLPVMVQCYHQIPLFSVLVNIFLLPLMTYLLGAALAGGIIACISAAVSGFILGTAYYILRLYQLVCDLVTAIPVHQLTVGHRSIVSVVVYYLVIIAVIFLLKRIRSLQKNDKYAVDNNSKKRGRLLVLAVGIIAINIVLFILPVTTDDAVFPHFSRSGISITNLDVGQGDCSHISLPDGSVIMIDGGSSDIKNVAEYRIVPYLRYMGESTVDYMIMTHSDADHISGFEEILEKKNHFGLKIKNIILPKINDPDENYLSFENTIRECAKETNLLYMETGDELRISGVTLTCLHPGEDYSWGDANDYSTVIELKYGNFKALFTGDLGFHGEEALSGELSAVGLSLDDVDYLKVGHHGSKYSSSESFLSVIRPEIAVASAGHDNRYHHPSPDAVGRLQTAGAKFYCTIESGAVTTHTDGKVINVDTYICE